MGVVELLWPLLDTLLSFLSSTAPDLVSLEILVLGNNINNSLIKNTSAVSNQLYIDVYKCSMNITHCTTLASICALVKSNIPSSIEVRLG